MKLYLPEAKTPPPPPEIFKAAQALSDFSKGKFTPHDLIKKISKG